MTKSTFKRLNTGQTFFFFFPRPQFCRQTDRTTTIGLAQRVQSFIVQSVASCLHPIQVNFWSRRSQDFAVLLPIRESCIDGFVNRCFPFARLERRNRPDRFLLPFDRWPGHRSSPACVPHCVLQRSRTQMARAFPLLKIITGISARMRDNCIRAS